jgi:hypothetical protein
LLPGVAVEVVSTGGRQIDVRIEGRPRRIAAALADAIYVAFEEVGVA